MSTPPQSLFLRVLNGPQQGAEIPLRAARYSVGSQDSCAIVLEGNGIQKSHVDLFFADGVLSVSQAQGPVLVDGATLEEFPADLPPLKPITLGEVSLAYGPAEASWPTPDTLSTPQTPDTSKPPPKIKRLNTKRLAWMICLVLIPVALGTTAALFGKHLVAIFPPIPQEDTLLRNIPLENLLLEPAFRAVRLTTSPLGDSVLSGHVPSEAHLNRLRALARRAGLSLDVVPLTQLEDSLNTLLNLYGPSLNYALEISPQNAIHLIVRGLVRNSTQTHTFEQILQRDLPQIEKIHVDILTNQQASQRTQAFLQAKPMFALVRVTTPNHTLLVSGSILGNFHQEWQTVQAQIRNALPHGTPLEIHVLQGPVFRGTLHSLFLGPRAHVRLAFPDQKPQIYHKGSSLPNSWTLQDIQDKGILLSKQGNTFIYPFP